MSRLGPLLSFFNTEFQASFSRNSEVKKKLPKIARKQDDGSGWVSFSLYLGTIVQEKVVPPGKRTEGSHGFPTLLVTMISLGHSLQFLAVGGLGAQRLPGRVQQLQADNATDSAAQADHRSACAQPSAHLPAGGGSRSCRNQITQRGLLFEIITPAVQAHSLPCFPRLSLGSGNKVNPWASPEHAGGKQPF